MTKRARYILLVACLLGSARQTYFYFWVQRHGQSERAGAEFVSLRPRLAGTLRIAYLAGEPLDGDRGLPRRHDRADIDYAKAQFTLAPTILDHRNPDLPWTLVVFKDAERLDRLLRRPGTRVLERPSATIALIERR